MESRYKHYTVQELKIALRRHNAKTSGRKAELVERLEAYDRNRGFSTSAPAEKEYSLKIPDLSLYKDINASTKLQDSAARVGADDSEQKMSDTSCDVDDASDVPIHKLPDEVMIYILTFLTLQERLLLGGVCKRWRHLSVESWPSIKRLKLRNVRNSVGFKYCRNIQELNISGMSITNMGLKRLLIGIGIQKVHDRCPKLQELSIDDCSHLTDEAFQILGQCLTITSLDISKAGVAVTSNGLMELCHLKHLEHLTAVDCPILNDAVLIAISQACRQLRTVLIQCDWDTEEQITDDGIESISDSSLWSLSQLENLKELVVSHSNHITDEGVQYLLTGCPRLQYLDLKNCKCVGNASVWAAIWRMKANPLQTLNLCFDETAVVSSKLPVLPSNLQLSCFVEDDDDDDDDDEDDDDDDFDDYGVDLDDNDDDDDDELNNFNFIQIGYEYNEFLEDDDLLDYEHWEML